MDSPGIERRSESCTTPERWRSRRPEDVVKTFESLAPPSSHSSRGRGSIDKMYLQFSGVRVCVFRLTVLAGRLLQIRAGKDCCALRVTKLSQPKRDRLSISLVVMVGVNIIILGAFNTSLGRLERSLSRTPWCVGCFGFAAIVPAPHPQSLCPCGHADFTVSRNTSDHARAPYA